MQRLGDRRGLPYALLAPGLLWLFVFFLIPLGYMLDISLQTGDELSGYERSFNFGIFGDAIGDYGGSSAARSFYAGLAHAHLVRRRLPAGLLHRVPGREVARTLLLLLVILPFSIHLPGPHALLADDPVRWRAVSVDS